MRIGKGTWNGLSKPEARSKAKPSEVKPPPQY